MLQMSPSPNQRLFNHLLKVPNDQFPPEAALRMLRYVAQVGPKMALVNTILDKIKDVPDPDGVLSSDTNKRKSAHLSQKLAWTLASAMISTGPNGAKEAEKKILGPLKQRDDLQRIAPRVSRCGFLAFFSWF
jgi:hypothetical protein